MIAFANVSKQYGKQVLFVDASFQLNPGEKVGLVGPNGAGKTTLFRMIVGEEVARRRRRVRAEEADHRLLPAGRGGDVRAIGARRGDCRQRPPRRPAPRARRAAARHGRSGSRADDMDRILARFGEVQEEYEHLGGYALESQAREVLHGLGFDDERIDGDVGALSGGWKMRVAMARVLLGKPDVLLMDEPTNHLDIESIIWLESFLKSQTGRAADDVARSRVHEPHRHEDLPRSTAAKSRSTRATTISTSASGRSARPIARPPTRASRRCSPRSSASSSGSRRTPPRPRRCRAASRRSTRSKRSSCRRSARVVKFEFRAAAAVGRPGRGHRGRLKNLWQAHHLRRLQHDDPPRRALGGDGPERRRQDDAAEDARRQR